MEHGVLDSRLIPMQTPKEPQVPLIFLLFRRAKTSNMYNGLYLDYLVLLAKFAFNPVDLLYRPQPC